jgi:hypothetical protein
MIYLATISSRKIFKYRLINYQWHKYLSTKLKMHACCQAPDSGQRARCALVTLRNTSTIH